MRIESLGVFVYVEYVYCVDMPGICGRPYGRALARDIGSPAQQTGRKANSRRLGRGRTHTCPLLRTRCEMGPLKPNLIGGGCHSLRDGPQVWIGGYAE